MLFPDSLIFLLLSTNTKEVIKNLTYLFNDRGNPLILISDRGTAFTSLEFQQFVKERKIEHRLVAVAAPWANGMVERVNRFLKSSLKKIVKEQLHWNMYIDKIQYVMNNTYHTALKASPSKLLFGYDQRNHTDSQMVQYLNKLANIELNSEMKRQDAREIAIEATNKIKEYNKSYYDERHKKPSIYKTDDFVMIRDAGLKPGEDSKLKPKYKGPYVVTRVLNKNRYVVVDIPGCNITRKPYNSILSTDRIKLWIKNSDDKESSEDSNYK